LQVVGTGPSAFPCYWRPTSPAEARDRSRAAYAAATDLMECLLLSCGALLVVANLDQLSFYLSHFV
jgi:hypothetical protein